ncbi:MAG: BrnT family toxin [Lysobacter sp.]|nr:BrnT family toxin [Lysobacter sp.]
MIFEWDAHKARSNQRKHGIFEAAADAFLDPLALSTQERIEGGESRWQLLGRFGAAQLALIVHTIHENEKDEEIIRIISARRSDRKERERYAQAEKDARSC